MPKDKKPAERYRRIHEIFTRRSGPGSVIKLQDLADEIGISLRQLSDDMKYLREKGAPFEYVPALRGWRYEDGRNFAVIDDQLFSDEEVLNVRMAIELFNKINPQDKAVGSLPKIFRKIYQASRKWALPVEGQKHIYFDPLPYYRGGKHLAFFLKSIEDFRRVEFQYLAFHADTPKTVVFDPWFLRHYDRRWYVGGFSHDPTEGFVRTFPLERIEGTPQSVGWFHDKPPSYDAATYWQNIYGITVPQHGRVEEVVLEFTALQGKYFTSSPFFEPYTIVEDNSEKLIISLRLIPNPDLVQKLASLGSAIKVLSPLALAANMESYHRKALKRYTS